MIENIHRHYALSDIPKPFGKSAKQAPHKDDGDFFFMLLLMLFFLDDESSLLNEDFLQQIMGLF